LLLHVLSGRPLRKEKRKENRLNGISRSPNISASLQSLSRMHRRPWIELRFVYFALVLVLSGHAP
jgi:hypothetical protein